MESNRTFVFELQKSKPMIPLKEPTGNIYYLVS